MKINFHNHSLARHALLTIANFEKISKNRSSQNIKEWEKELWYSAHVALRLPIPNEQLDWVPYKYRGYPTQF